MVAQVDFYAQLSGLGKELAVQREKATRQRLLSGAMSTDGTVDFGKAIMGYAQAGDLEGAGKMAAIQKAIAPESSAELQGYKYAVAQGYKGSLLDYTKEKAAAGAPRVNNSTNVNTGEKEYDKALNKDLADVFLGYQKSGRTASNAKNTLDLMENLTNDPNFYSGSAAPLVTRGKQALVSMGVSDPKSASANELFESLGNKLVMDSQGGSLGAQISNADVKYIAATVPGLEKTPEGNRQIIGVQRKLYQRQQDVAKMARDYAARNGGRLDYKFDEGLAKWAHDNPLFPATAPRATPGKTKSGVGWSVVE